MALPAIQLIDKADFTKHHIVTLTSPPALPPLAAPNSARLRAHTVALTTNNLTYARRGGVPLLGWWGMWPTPPPSCLAQPFDDPEMLAGYCRIPAWGFGEVVESTIPALPAGTLLFGQQPVGTLPETVELEAVPEVPGHWRERSARRAGINPVYNRYVVLPAERCGEAGAGERDGRGWDALAGVLHQTAYLLNRFVFSWGGPVAAAAAAAAAGDAGEAVPPVHPQGRPDLAWTEADADLSGAVVVMLAASGKTALCLARELRGGRPAEKQPAKLIAVGSERSRAFTAGTALFDDVLLYADAEDPAVDLAARLGGRPRQKVVLVDFGARGEAVDKWAAALAAGGGRLQVLVVGSDPLAKAPSETAKRAEDPASGVVQVWVGGVRDRAIELVGAAAFFAAHEAAWAKFKADSRPLSPLPGLHLKWGSGMPALREGWDALARGEIGPDAGLVFEM